MKHLRPLHLLLAALLLSSAHAQLTLCPGEPVQFELQDEYHGEMTWEFSADGDKLETIAVKLVSRQIQVKERDPMRAVLVTLH